MQARPTENMFDTRSPRSDYVYQDDDYCDDDYEDVEQSQEQDNEANEDQNIDQEMFDDQNLSSNTINDAEYLSDSTQESSVLSSTTNNGDNVSSTSPINITISSYEQVDFTTRKSVEFYAKAKEQGIGRNNIDWLIEWINDLIQDPSFERRPLLSQHRSRNIITSTCSVQPVQYDVCKDGCYLFFDDKKTKCPSCNKPRFKEGTQTSQATTQILPISHQLASYFQSAALRDLLEYRWRRVDGGSTLKDVFDGAAYREMRSRLFQQPLDIGISIFHDGFNIFKRKSYTITVVMAMLLNLPPEERFKKENLLLLATIPGPGKPKMIDSFLRPIREELKVLQEDGMRITTDDGVFNSRVQLIFTGGDIPALGDLVGNSHMSYYGCRICVVKGVRGDKGGIYFPTSDIAAQSRTPSSFRKGSEVSITIIILYRNRGLTKKQPLAKLKSFHGPYFFSIDEMHLLGNNIGHQVWNMICGKYGKKAPIALKKKYRSAISKGMASACSTIPNTFEGTFINLETQAGYARAVDWIAFMRYILPTLVIEQIDKQQQEAKPDYKKDSNAIKDAKKALIALSKIYCLALQKEINVNEIGMMERQQSTYTDQQSEPSMTDPVSQASSTTSFTILIDDEPGTTVMLDQLDTSTLDEFDDLSLRSLLLDFYSRHSIHHNNHIANAIHTSKNLTIRGHIFSVSTRQNAKKLNFAKITLPFDLRARRGQRSTENLCWGETFGTILLLFTHEHNEKTRALCLVRLELDTAPSVGSGIPCGNRQRQRLYWTFSAARQSRPQNTINQYLNREQEFKRWCIKKNVNAIPDDGKLHFFFKTEDDANQHHSNEHGSNGGTNVNDDLNDLPQVDAVYQVMNMMDEIDEERDGLSSVTLTTTTTNNSSPPPINSINTKSPITQQFDEYA
ncbi:hypothetical protein INT45_010278 [Circinella minor]|uniref:Uncharacterized protein n=1 Tax=Circinella minor TaxID=1195481 RepID=A0A8H7RUC9_9FUNG|nr:hypothetical protein INT45_010278 [Circinella minor]